MANNDFDYNQYVSSILTPTKKRRNDRFSFFNLFLSFLISTPLLLLVSFISYKILGFWYGIFCATFGAVIFLTGLVGVVVCLIKRGRE